MRTNRKIRGLRTALAAGLLGLGCLSPGSWLLAQQAEPRQITPDGAQPIGADAKAAITAAYARTQNAQTVEDYTEVIELCANAQVIGLSPPQEQYIKQLIAWAHNRRGEALSSEAAKRAQQQDAKQAAALDARALADFEIAVNNDPTKWKALHNRGVSLALVGRFEEAIEDFSRVLELNPDYENAWYNRGEIHYELGKYAEAVEDYNKTLQLKPGDFGAVTSRGHAYFQLKRFRESLIDYIEAVRLQPSNAVAYLHRADAYRSLGMWDQAATDYRTAIQRDKSLGRAYQSAAWLMATCPDARFRDPERAVQAAQEAIRLDGDDDYRYLDTLAAALANAGEFDEALQVLATATEKAPAEERGRLQQRAELFQKQQPYRQAPTSETADSPDQPQR